MIAQALVVCMLMAPPVAPVGSPSTIKVGKLTGYLAGASPLQLRVTGPTVLVLELRGPAGKQQATVDIVRNDEFRSTNAVTLRKGKGPPRGYPTQAKLMLTVPEGEHTYSICASIELVVMSSTAKASKKALAAAPEVPLQPPVPPALAAAPEPVEPTPAAPGTSEPTTEPVDSAEAPSSTVEAPQAVADLDTAPANRGMRVAVSPLEVQGVEANVAVVVTDSLVAELRKLSGISAVGMDEIQDMLSHESAKQMAGCDDDSCMAEIAGALGVDQVLTGSLTRAADSHVISLRRVDQNRASVVGAFNQRLKVENGQEFLLAVGPAVETLFPERELRAGASRGVPREVALRLDPPPLPTWTFWTVASGSAAAAVAGGVFAILFAGAQDQYSQLAALSRTEPVSGAQLVAQGRQVEQHAWTANGLFIGAGVLALSAGVMFLFTDWEGYGDAE